MQGGYERGPDRARRHTVHAYPPFCQRLFHNVFAVRLICYVARKQYALASLRLHKSAGFLRILVLIVITDENVRALFGKSQGHRPPKPLSPPVMIAHLPFSLPAAR